MAIMDRIISNRRGFTLLELIAVMMILGLLAALEVPRYLDLEATATRSGIDAAVSELNGREGLVWGQVKTTLTSYNRATGDSVVWELMKNDKTKSYPYLGEGYEWAVLPTQTGGTLIFKRGSEFTLSRSKSTIAVPGHWRRVP
jgi:prepilin-type N-terminal cleavage/methylation domain-containing protein